MDMQQQQALLLEQILQQERAMDAKAALIASLSKSTIRSVFAQFVAASERTAEEQRIIASQGQDLLANEVVRHFLKRHGTEAVRHAEHEVADDHKSKLRTAFSTAMQSVAEKARMELTHKGGNVVLDHVLRESKRIALDESHKALQESQPLLTSAVALQEKIQELTPPVIRRVLRGEPPPPCDDLEIGCALDIFENQYVNENSTLSRVLQAHAAPMQLADLPDIEALYEPSRLTKEDVMEFRLGGFEELREKISKKGVFLAPFKAYEQAALEKLIVAEAKAREILEDGGSLDNFEEELPISCVLRDAFTKELLAMAVITVPPKHPKEGTAYWNSMQETLKKWSRKKRKKLEKPFTSGRVGMLLLVMGKVKHAAALAMCMCAQKVAKQRPDLQTIWSFFLQNMEMTIEKNLDPRVEEFPSKVIPPTEIGNTPSNILLTTSGFETSDLYKAGAQNPERVLFEIHDDNAWLHEIVGIDADWQLVMASVRVFVERTRSKMRQIILACGAKPHDLDERIQRFIAA